MASWGRHGWPRTNEGMRLYRERDGSYLMVAVDNSGYRGYEGVANCYSGPEPSLGSTTINRSYTYDKGCKRVQWSELPVVWKKAFKAWLTQNPSAIRGFWLVGNQPQLKVKVVR